MVLSVVVGTLLRWRAARASGSCERCGWCYVETIRNTPFLVQLFVLFFGLPSLGIRLERLYRRADRARALQRRLHDRDHPLRPAGGAPSQIEAGLSIGMSRLQVFCYVVLVPALEKVYPALSSQFVLLMLAPASSRRSASTS